MAVDAAILEAFFEECDDLLTALADGIAEMRDGTAGDDTVNAVFRSVHSIKGAAGAFAMDDLVSFAHTFETVLDRLRGDEIAVDDALLKVLQRAGDILADLVDAARDGHDANPSVVDPVVAELQNYIGEQEPEEEFSFEALTLDFPQVDPPKDQSFCVSFTPNAAFFATGNDTITLIRALHELGDCTVKTDTTKLPNDFEDFDWQDGHLSWTITMTGDVQMAQIQEVFEFVNDLCDLSIVSEEQNTGPDLDAQFITPPVAEPPQDTAPAPVEVAPTPEKPKENAEPPKKRAQASLRVDPERIDRLINSVGELIINQSVISQRIEEAGLSNAAELHAELDDYKLLARDIQEGVMAIRAQPVKSLFQRMQRIGREAASATGKFVEISTEGEETEVDKTMVERLADPLTHMVRNAIDHGVEMPDKRLAAGKKEVGTLKLRAQQRSGSIVIEIIDDGAGLNRQRIRDLAVERGLISANAQLSEQEIDQLLFAPGFSTAQEVTNLSGRGVGMDVVKTAISELGGRIAITSQPGAGTTFAINLPLTLAVMDGMVVAVSGQTMVLPIASILESVRPSHEDISTYGLNGALLRIRGEYVPIIELAQTLGRAASAQSLTDRVLLLVQTETVPLCALAVDEIYDQRQIVVKSMQENYGAIDGVSGATILGDGKIALIVDPDAIATNISPAARRLPAVERTSHDARPS